MGADFLVGLEVRPSGSGLKDTARDTRILTEDTRKLGTVNREVRPAVTELEASEKRRKATLDELSRATRANNLALAQAKTDIAQYHQRVEAAAEAKRRATGVVNSFRAALVALQVVIAALGLGALVRDAVNFALSFDRANKSLVAAAGSQQAAGREMAFVSAEADRLGLVLTTTAQTYAGLSNAARGTVLQGQAARDIFSAVSEAATVLGLSADQTSGALLGVQQTISKGRVTAEELVQQISERLPGAYQAMADSLGISTTELAKRLEQGKVGLKDLIGWAEELRKRFAAGLTTAVNSYQANLNRLTNLTNELKRNLGEGFLSGFLAGFADLKGALSAEDLKAAARDLGESIGKALRTAADAGVFLAKNLELVKAVLTAILALKVAAWFVSLAGAIATATGSTLIFKSALSSLAIAGPLAAIGIALLAVIVVMEKYIMTTRLAMEAEMERVARSQELFAYYQQLRANKVGLTEAEAAYALEVQTTMETERAALALSLARATADLERVRSRSLFQKLAYPESEEAAAEKVKDLQREVQTVGNALNGLNKEWLRLDKLPTIKLPVDAAPLDKAAKKVADLLTGFARAAEQAERIRAAQASGGAPAVARVTAEIERQNAAYQALHSMEGLSAASKQRLTGIIEGLVERTQAANRETAEGAAETQRALAFTAAAAEAEARLADAKGQTGLASREAAIQAQADTIARENQKEEDAEYVAGLLQVIRTREDYLAGIALEVAAVERQIAQAATLRQRRAELVDAQAQDTAATRRLTVELDAETEARARGVQIGSIWYQLLLAISASRAQEVADLDQQTAAQRRLNDAQAAQARTRAEFTDWNRQREAAKEYGSEIAGILQSYGLLSEATRDLALHEQALAIQRDEGGARTIEQIEEELRGYAALEQTLARVAAGIELQAYVMEPLRSAVMQVGETLQSAVIDRLIDGQIEAEDLGKTLLRSMLHAIAEMLKRWVLAHRAMQAEAMRTAAVNAAAAQAGGGGGGVGANIPGLATGSYAQAGGAGGMSSTAVGAAWTVAIFAAIYFGVSQWIKTSKEQIASVTFRLQEEVGGAVFDIRGNSERVKGLTAAIQEAGKTVAEWLHSIGGQLERATREGEGAVSVWREGQGKNTSWYVATATGVHEWFASQEEAFNFAMVEALRQATISGLDPIVAAALKNNVFRTMEELQAGIADAMKVASFGQAGATADFRATTAEMDRLRASMRDMIGTGAELADAMARITAQEVLLLQSQRDAITGHQRTAEEEYQMRLREAEAWNAERGVRLQSIALLILETKARIATYKATNILIRGDSGGGRSDGGGGLMGLGKSILWMAGVAATATEIIAGSGDAQLDALEAYLKSLQDLYDAINNLPPIDPSEVARSPKGGHGGGGGGNREGRAGLLEEVASWGLSDVGQQLAGVGDWFDDFKKRLESLGFSAAKTAELMALAAAEMERRRQEIKANQMRASSDFINAGTAAGGPLMKGLADNRKTQLDLIQANRDLQKQGLLTMREMRDLNKAIHEAGVRQRDQMIASAADQLFLELYGLLGDEAAAAQLRFDITVAELDLRREELRLAMLTAGYTQERMEAILGPLGVLLDRVRAAGPAIFSGGGGGGTGGSGSAGAPPGFQGTSVGQQRWRDGIKWRWDGSAWVQIGTYGGSGGGSASNDNNSAAEELRQRYRDAGRSEYVLALEQIGSDFATLRATFGDTAELANLFAAAMGRLRTQFLEGVQEFYDQLNSGALGGANVEQQYGAAMANYQRLLLAVQGGDLTQANALAQAGQDLVRLAGQMWGTSTGGFVELRDAILAQLRQILGLPGQPIGGQSAAGLPPGSPLTGLQGPAGGAGQPAASQASQSDEKMVAATDRVAGTVDFTGRKLERLLTRLADTLDEIKTLAEDSRGGQPAPLNYGRGGS